MIANLLAAIRFRQSRYGATSANVCENTAYSHVLRCHRMIGAFSYI